MGQMVTSIDYFDSSALVKRYLAEMGSACALHLNRALLEDDLPPLILIAADEDLLKAAQAEGLETENPNHYP